MKRSTLTLSGPSILLVGLVAAFVPVRIFDPCIFSLLNSWHSPVTDPVWFVLTSLGDGLVLGIIVGALIVRNSRAVAMGIPLLLISSLAVNCTKAILPSLRPAEVLDAVHVVGPLLRSGSFPSGHAAAGMAAGLAVAYGSASRFVGTGALILGALIGISRIFVGAHFPSDVLAGMICPLALFTIYNVTVRKNLEKRIPDRPPSSRREFRIFLGMEIFAAVFLILVYGPYFSDSPTICVVVGSAAVAFVAIGWRLSSAPPS